MNQPPVIRRITEAGGIATAGAGYRTGSNPPELHLEALLPLGVDRQLVTDLRAAGWHVTVTPTTKVLR